MVLTHETSFYGYTSDTDTDLWIDKQRMKRSEQDNHDSESKYESSESVYFYFTYFTNLIDMIQIKIKEDKHLFHPNQVKWIQNLLESNTDVVEKIQEQINKTYRGSKMNHYDIPYTVKTIYEITYSHFQDTPFFDSKCIIIFTIIVIETIVEIEMSGLSSLEMEIAEKLMNVSIELLITELPPVKQESFSCLEMFKIIMNRWFGINFT